MEYEPSAKAAEVASAIFHGMVPACPSCFGAAQVVPFHQIMVVLAMIRFNRVRGCRCHITVTPAPPHIPPGWVLSHADNNCPVNRASHAFLN